MNVPVSAPVSDRGLLARTIGMVTAPTDTFRAVVSSPRPFGVLLLACVVLVLATAGPQFTARGRQAALDMQVQQVEKFTRQPVAPQAYAQMERQAERFGPYFAAIGTFVFVPVMSLFFTALYWVAFNTILGGTAAFKQVLAIVTHSQVITALGAAVTAPIQYASGVNTPTGPFNLGALAPMLDPNSFLATFLGMLTVFQIWAVVVTAIGLAVLYNRTRRNVTIALLAFHGLVMAGFAAVPALFFR